MPLKLSGLQQHLFSHKVLVNSDLTDRLDWAGDSALGCTFTGCDSRIWVGYRSIPSVSRGSKISDHAGLVLTVMANV